MSKKSTPASDQGSADLLIALKADEPWPVQRDKIQEQLRANTIISLRTQLKNLGYAEKTDKKRKDDLIDDILNYKHKEWLVLAKPAPTMTSLADARATKKRKRWENESLDQAPSIPEKRARIPAFMQQKEREASELRVQKNEAPSVIKTQADGNKRQPQQSNKDRDLLFKEVTDFTASDVSRPASILKPKLKDPLDRKLGLVEKDSYQKQTPLSAEIASAFLQPVNLKPIRKDSSSESWASAQDYNEQIPQINSAPFAKLDRQIGNKPDINLAETETHLNKNESEVQVPQMNKQQDHKPSSGGSVTDQIEEANNIQEESSVSKSQLDEAPFIRPRMPQRSSILESSKDPQFTIGRPSVKQRDSKGPINGRKIFNLEERTHEKNYAQEERQKSKPKGDSNLARLPIIQLQPVKQSKWRRTALTTLAISVFSIALIIGFILKPTPFYCPSSGPNPDRDCLPCPQLGSCDKNGILTCVPGAMQIKDTLGQYTCVESAENKQKVVKVARNLEMFLQTKRGMNDCGEIDSYSYSYDDLKAKLIKEQIGNTGDQEQSENLTVKAMTQVELILKHFDKLVEERKYDIQWLNKEGKGYSDTQNVVFYSNGARKSFSCTIKQFIWANLFNIIAITSFVGWMYRTISGCFKSREINRVARAFYGDVKQSLKSMQGTSFTRAAGLSQADILRKYLAMPQMKDHLKRDEKTFTAQIWPILQQYRMKDKSIKSISRIEFGKQVEFWQTL